MASSARKGENESWFRDLNERLEDRAASADDSTDRFDIVCECAREDCTERIAISFAGYEAVRARPTAFIVVSGHVDESCERVVSSVDAYKVVEKLGPAAAVAEVENPRNGQ